MVTDDLNSFSSKIEIITPSWARGRTIFLQEFCLTAEWQHHVHRGTSCAAKLNNVHFHEIYTICSRSELGNQTYKAEVPISFKK